MIACPTALARSLRPLLAAPTAVARLLSDQDAVRAFRRLVEEVFPADWRAIWDARDGGGDRESSRVSAFCGRVNAALFPLYEAEQYDQVAYEVPLVRFGWSFDRYHDLDCPPGEGLLLALCAAPFVVDAGARLAILDAAEPRLGRDLVAQIPPDGLTPEELHARLDGTPYAATAAFADWLFGRFRSDLAAWPTVLAF